MAVLTRHSLAADDQPVVPGCKLGKQSAYLFCAMTIGDELRYARERLGLSREHISLATKIQVRKIAALEENAFDKLQSGIYLDGIVTAYAREVGVDGQALVQRLRAHLAPPPPETLAEIAAVRQSSQRPPLELRLSLAHGMFAFGSVVMILAILGVAVHVLSLQPDSEPQQTVATARTQRVAPPVGQGSPAVNSFPRELGTTGFERDNVLSESRPIAEGVLAAERAALPEIAPQPRPLDEPGAAPTPPVAEQRRTEPLAGVERVPFVAASNLAGAWTLETQIESSSLRTFEGLRLGYRLELRQDGDRIEGTGRKISENGVSLRGRRQTPIVVQGMIDGGRLRLTFGEQGTRRRSTGTFDLVLEGREVLRGLFASDAARSAGVVEARRL